MDDKQKELLNSVDMVAAIKFTDLIKCKRLTRLVPEDKIDEIRREFDSEQSRNLMLLGAIQRSELPDAFDEFVEILRSTHNDQALKLVSCHSPRIKLSSPSLHKLLEKYLPSGRSRRQSSKYPLGLTSGQTPLDRSASMSPQSAGSCDGAANGKDSSLSPYKEKHHQVTVIGSGVGGGGGRSGGGGCYRMEENSSPTQDRVHVSRPRLQGLSPITATTTTSTPTTANTGYQIKPKQKFTTQASQTPIKPQELALLAQNMSISDSHEEYSEANCHNEPVVSWHPYAHTQSGGHQDSHRSASPCAAHYCNPSYASSESDSSSDSIILDSNIILDASITMAIGKERANTMAVKTATVCHENPNEDYKMTSAPRGPCLIVNNIDFEAEMFPTRKGSDEDARRFDDIFRQLGFTVIMRRNQTAEQMKKLFKDVASECKPEHDALFVFILSHGSEHGIYGTDGLEVYLESEIISCFDNRNCKAMLGKPKVFVIQACRGRARDGGGSEGGDMTDSIACSSVPASPNYMAHSQENRVPTSWLPASQPSEGKKRKHPIRTDMLLVFSCLAGFVSVRNELAGSWLGVALAYFIMTHAHERDLLRILNLVASDVIQRESSHGHIQSIELKLLGWTKNLYFNPGIFRRSG